jgi:hypothetical protein
MDLYYACNPTAVASDLEVGIEPQPNAKVAFRLSFPRSCVLLRRPKQTPCRARRCRAGLCTQSSCAWSGDLGWHRGGGDADPGPQIPGGNRTTPGVGSTTPVSAHFPTRRHFRQVVIEPSSAAMPSASGVTVDTGTRCDRSIRLAGLAPCPELLRRQRLIPTTTAARRTLGAPDSLSSCSRQCLRSPFRFCSCSVATAGSSTTSGTS